jgi:hypothetical protein
MQHGGALLRRPPQATALTLTPSPPPGARGETNAGGRWPRCCDRDLAGRRGGSAARQLHAPPALVMRGSAASPSWYDQPPLVYQSGLPPPVPQLSMSNLSASPALSTAALKLASAVGLRQMLPARRRGGAARAAAERLRRHARRPAAAGLPLAGRRSSGPPQGRSCRPWPQPGSRDHRVDTRGLIATSAHTRALTETDEEDAGLAVRPMAGSFSCRHSPDAEPRRWRAA